MGERPGLAVVTPAEMAAIDAAAPEPTHVLIERAGAATARAAVRLLGGTYGRRIVVLAGTGNNGNDGRSAAVRLARAGIVVRVVEALDAPAVLPPCDLVIDAAFGTGFRGSWRAPTPAPGTSPLVLAVDIPSGIDGTTGLVGVDSAPLAADATVTFAALKPGLLFADGRRLAGTIEVADIGLDTTAATTTLLTDATVAAAMPRRAPDDHKWRSAVWVIAGSPGMDGAAALACGGAARAGAGYVRLSIPDGGTDAPHVPPEVVRTELPITGWGLQVLNDSSRFGALVVGNGLGAERDPGELAALLVGDTPSSTGAGNGHAAGARVPVVIDGDGLTLLADADLPAPLGDHVVLTPHDGEFTRLAGAPPGPDRVEDTRRLAATLGAVVLAKGPTTVVAHPEGRVLVVTTGDDRLATAGTGDVLAGVVGALCAGGVEPWLAAGMAAHLHGRAAALGWRMGLVASDLVGLLPEAIAAVAGDLPAGRRRPPGEPPGRFV